ncbi:hypothetical protein BJ978_001552 [Agromyces terreus]|uniref:Uncharacterized protein n=1 Tax=Agromyces terreus TaxID=424795 RepID=A0A9X2H0D9_9MICO|nr:hypothetical protein [Agromyces terreus]
MAVEATPALVLPARFGVRSPKGGCGIRPTSRQD